jgi:hypothetical protein
MPRPRFTLRGLLVAITLLACWLGYSANWMRQRRAVLRTGKVLSELTLPNRGLEVSAPFTLRILGEPGHRQLLVAPLLWNDHDEQKRIRELFPEAKVVKRAWR